MDFLFCLVFGNKFKQFVGRTFKDIAQRVDDFVLNGFGFVVDHFVEILITHPELNIQPILGFFVFFEQFQHAQFDHIYHLNII